MTRSSALNDPKAVRSNVISDDEHRDIDSVRVSNKTTFDLGGGNKVDVGAFFTGKSLFHPITNFVGVIDQDSFNYGVFAQGSGSYTVGNYLNRFRVGVTTHFGKADAAVFVSNGGRRGALTTDSNQSAYNLVVYGENQFFVTPKLALITGGQVVWSRREVDEKLSGGAPGGGPDGDTFESFNPRVGACTTIAKPCSFLPMSRKASSRQISAI